MKGKIMFYDLGMEDFTTLDIRDVVSIEEGQNCIIIENNDGFLFETHRIKFTQE